MSECNCPRASDGKRIGGSSTCPVHALAPGGADGGGGREVSDHIKELERQLASYQACRVRDVDEKAWLSKRMSELEAALTKEKGGWDAFYKLRRSVGEDRYPGMTGEVTAKETPAEPDLTKTPSIAMKNEMREILGLEPLKPETEAKS